MTKKYKPHLPSDKKYIKKLSKIIKTKQPLEDIKFEYLSELLNILGFQENPYELISQGDLNSKQIQLLVDRVFKKINNIKLTSEIKEKLFKLWDYLVELDSLEKADLIFVFGGRGLNRAKGAVKLYKNGFANKILFTGYGASFVGKVEISEAEYLANFAKDEGVKRDDIILETKARNTPENVVNSVKILKKKMVFHMFFSNT